MTLVEIAEKLDLVKTNINQWIEQGYTPTIEKDVALKNLQQIYDSLAGGKPVVSQKPDFVDNPPLDVLEYPQTSFVNEPQQPTVLNVAQPTELAIEPIAQKTMVVPAVPAQPINTPQIQPTMVVLLGQKISQSQRDTFIRELFWKDEAFFANEMRKFQEITSLDEALIYIGEKYNWSASNIFAEQFIGLLENYYNK